MAHVVIDGVIGDASAVDTSENGESLLDPEAIADAYWQVATRDRSAWTLELDLRPFREKFFD